MLTIERMYELACRVAQTAPVDPACDREDLVQCAVIGMVEAGVSDEALAIVVARRRIVDEIRRLRGRRRPAQQPHQAAVHHTYHLFQPFPGGEGACLADVIPAEDDLLETVESQLDAHDDATALLRAVGRRAKHVLVWYVVQERSLAEIALRYGVTPSRVSQIATAALDRAREVHAARGRRVSTGRAPSRPRDDSRGWYEATSGEKRAFGEFRRLQRAGLRRQEALAALSETQRDLVAEYQRKNQRRARARAAGELMLRQAPRGPRTPRRLAVVSQLITRAARFFEMDQRYVGSALAAYRQQHGLDDAALITYLDCPRERLAALALVRRPDPAAPDFSDQVTGIAAYIGCRPNRLTSLLAAS